MLSAARKFSARSVDADDAYQRTAEIFLLRAPETDDEDYLLAWALTVVRNEALAIYRRSVKTSNCAPEQLIEIGASAALQPEERVISAERIRLGQEALSRLRPEHLRCLLLRADGFGYEQISATTGYSYTKVNRYLSEGRAALRDRVERIESGAECRRLAGVLSMMADGVATAEATADARHHIDNCLACRTTMREYRVLPSRVAAYAPLAILSPAAAGGSDGRAGSLARQLGDAAQSLLGSFQDRLVTYAGGGGPGAELAFAKKAMIVTAVSASLVAGGVTVEHVATPDDKPSVEQPTGTTGATSQSVPSPVDSTPGVADDAIADADRRPPREARQSDVVGERAVTQVPGDEPPAAQRGDSVDGPEQPDAPPPASTESGGSGSPGSDLAP